VADELPWPLISVSAVTRDGLPDLERQMRLAVFQGVAPASDAPLVTNPRHKNALLRAERHLTAAEAGVASGAPPELVAVDLTATIGALGEITGETVTEELLETIFSRFCIGK
ncbi:MAG: tRNA uridine-5-carboxymethylaminomethyl(34) synthesis GTPase MnmE, partial [Chloroflexi bacterium]|nr:tRNA uridine-5-carboxymethylaminomethyl(34) synthesis GTPase MnmE [Chloroflexota bacterium]